MVLDQRVRDLAADVATVVKGKAALDHTHTASQVTDFDAAADARIASSTSIVKTTGNQTIGGDKTFNGQTTMSGAIIVPNNVFGINKINGLNSALLGKTDATRVGLYSARPLATAVIAGTRYFATDVEEEYLSNGTAWSVLSGSSELGYAEQIPIFTNNTTTPQPIPGLTSTVRVGERPVLVSLNMRMANGGAGSVAVARVRMDGTEIFRIEHNNYSVGTWNSTSSARRIGGITPGTTHTFDVTFSLLTGVTGNALTAGDATNPNNLSIRSV